jgi:hypothetical protein
VTTVELVTAYARRLAEDLTRDMKLVKGEMSGSWWAADSPEAKAIIHGRAAAALEFLRQYAGPESHWLVQGIESYTGKVRFRDGVSGCRALSGILLSWVDQVEAGVTEIMGARTWAETAAASTDLMTQVRRLMEDRQAHPAAAIVLSGAALEMGLRGAMEAKALQLDPGQRASIAAYKAALQRAGFLSKQLGKDIDQVAGLRNDAAHGQLEALSRERAGLMEQQTNLLLDHLAEVVAAGPPAGSA